MTISTEKANALRLILENLVNGDDPTIAETVSGILGILGHDTGKTLRDEFAMVALQAMGNEYDLEVAQNRAAASGLAYAMADAMMKARGL